MIAKWREDHMRRNTAGIDTDDDSDSGTYRKYYSDKIGGIITYVTCIEDVNVYREKDDVSLITKAHKLVLLFKFIAAFGIVKFDWITLERITVYLEIAIRSDLDELMYYAALLT